MRTHRSVMGVHASLSLIICLGYIFAQSAAHEFSCTSVNPELWSDESCDAECHAASITEVPSINGTVMDFGGSLCPPRRCMCDIVTDGETIRASLLYETTRCFTFRAYDKEQFLAVNITSLEPAAKLKVYLRTGTGSEGRARIATSHEHDYKLSVDGSPTAVMRVERSQWRKKLGRKDEGEWVGPWTMCVKASGTSHKSANSVAFEAFVDLATCPMGPSYRECAGRGQCVAGYKPCPKPLESHQCRADVCACLPGLNPPDCATGELIAPPPFASPPPPSPPPSPRPETVADIDIPSPPPSRPGFHVTPHPSPSPPPPSPSPPPPSPPPPSPSPPPPSPPSPLSPSPNPPPPSPPPSSLYIATEEVSPTSAAVPVGEGEGQLSESYVGGDEAAERDAEIVEVDLELADPLPIRGEGIQEGVMELHNDATLEAEEESEGTDEWLDQFVKNVPYTALLMFLAAVTGVIIFYQRWVNQGQGHGKDGKGKGILSGIKKSKLRDDCHPL